MRVFFFLWFLAAMAKAQPYIPKFDVQGHRGARGLMPENTIPAFVAALDSGVTTLELDVVITHDGQVVVSHEPWMSAAICLQPDGSEIEAKDERRYNIYEMSYAQVRQYDCGSKGNARFPEQQKQRTSKPLLTDVIKAVEDHIKGRSGYEVDYNIEIKSMPEGDGRFHPKPEEFSDRVHAVIDAYLPWDRVVIQSFDFRVLRYWHGRYPDVRLAALVENKKSIDDNLADLGFTPSIYSPYFKLLTRSQVKYLHQKKIRVIPWTVNDPKDMLAVKGMNVDGLITDYPNRAARYKWTLRIKAKG
ncbi:MAG: glycerophosphodiester phosphodiesterase [Cyclobacteriaceae bacterium]|jgi:glycerophosphoryl diester phosphodiesterase|nr:glycerophosphodiester phosphodiesterase [Cyclobacteriaceae bacterium]